MKENKESRRGCCGTRQKHAIRAAEVIIRAICIGGQMPYEQGLAGGSYHPSYYSSSITSCILMIIILP